MEPQANIPTDADAILDVVLGALGSLWKAFLQNLPLLFAGVVVLLLTWGVASLFDRFFNRFIEGRRIRRSFKDLLHRLLRLGIWFGGLMIAATVIFPGLTPSKALAALSLGSVAIGLAFKDIFENFFAGLLILWRYPFEKGDFIECSGLSGQIEKITVRNTFLRRTTGELVVIPNAEIFKSSVSVLTNQKARRVEAIVGIDYDQSIDEARELIRQALNSSSTVIQSRPLQIFVQEFAESSINFQVCWWAGSRPVEQRTSKDEVLTAIKTILDEHQVDIPFPHRTLTFKEQLETRLHSNGSMQKVLKSSAS